MSTIDINKLEQALEKKEYSEVATVLDGFFKAKLAPEDEGLAYGTLITLYLRAINGINHRYLERLDELVKEYQTAV